MKKIYIVMAFLVCFLGCQNTFNGNGDSKNETDLAKVKIPLPNAGNARSIGINDIISNTNFFEAAFKKNDISDYHFAEAFIEQGYIEAIIPEGNYDILLFAGHKDDPDGYASLLASSYAQNVDITLTGPNVINMELASFDVDIIVPSKVAFGTTYSITLTIDTKNPLLVWKGGGWFGLDLWSDDNDTSIPNDGFTKEGNIYTYTMTLTAPMEAGSVNIFHFDYVSPFHVLPPTTFTTRTPHQILESNKTIEFVAGADVQINLNWPQ
jgi:hypothetical protein